MVQPHHNIPHDKPDVFTQSIRPDITSHLRNDTNMKKREKEANMDKKKKKKLGGNLYIETEKVEETFFHLRNDKMKMLKISPKQN